MGILKVFLKSILIIVISIVVFIAIAIIFAIVFLFIIPNLNYTVSVYDNDTGKPLQNAKITVRYEMGIDGGGRKTFSTDQNGKAVFSMKNIDDEAIGATGRLESFLVEKDGYHFGGINSYQKASLRHNYTIKLNKYKNPKNLILATVTFHEKDGANFLEAVLTKDINKIKNLPSNSDISKIDFDFPEVANSETEKNHIGKGTATIRFYGEGGVQQLPGGVGKSLMTDHNYALDNLFIAPVDGYSKELSLMSGGEYVAKLRDGKHYMKFTTFISKDLDGINYAEITFYIQPLENNNLEVNLTSLESNLKSIVDENTFSGAYDSPLDKDIMANIYDFQLERNEINRYDSAVFNALK